MIKKIGLILSLSSSFIFAQNMRFVYEVSMKNNKESAPTVENAHLDVVSNKSVFYGEKNLKRDSIMQRNFQTRNFGADRSQMEQLRGLINYSVEKDINTQKIIFKNRIGRDSYAYEEDRTLDWKISSETTTIGEYKVQKAETEFAGRKWIAWFTQDIPIMNGPYKFHGLPGLIVKIEDSAGDYIFNLKETKSISELPNIGPRGNTITVKRKEYEKQWEKYRKDPISFMNSSRGNMPSGPRSGNSGNTPPGQGPGQGPDQQQMKEMEKRIKEEIERDNNPLEIL